MSLVVPARAKLNLDLAVLARTDDGYHELTSHIQAVALHDVLELGPAERTTITCSGHQVPDTGHNTVLKAHAAVEAAAGRPLPTEFHLDKRIPPGSGMGGASSDAAATLRGLAAIHRLDIDLAALAAEVGADVPFFLAGGTALVEGRGERLRRLPTEEGWFAIAWPGIELSTASVYRAWDEVKGEGRNQLSRAAAHADPRVGEFARRLGPEWQMTGSGSAFFMRCPDEAAAGKAVVGLECWTAATHAVAAWA